MPICLQYLYLDLVHTVSLSSMTQNQRYKFILDSNLALHSPTHFTGKKNTNFSSHDTVAKDLFSTNLVIVLDN